MIKKEATVTYTYDEAIVSDRHKEAFGFRPSEGFWVNWNCASDDAKQTIWDALLLAQDSRVNDQKAAYDDAKSEYEVRLAEYISIGAKDRATAIRWLVQSLELTETDKWYGAEYICHTLGLPNSMKSEFKGVV